MNARPNTVCRIVNYTAADAPFDANNNRLVMTDFHCANCGLWHAEALQTLVGGFFEIGLYCEVPAGARIIIDDYYLRPLGDDGVEESDLFKTPEEKTVAAWYDATARKHGYL